MSYIRIFDNAVSKKDCKKLITHFESHEDKRPDNPGMASFRSDGLLG